MDQTENGSVLYSATDIINFMGCRHASYLDSQELTVNRDPEESTAIADEMSTAQLIQQKEHEKNYLESFKNEGRSVTEIPPMDSIQEQHTATHNAMKSAVEVIYQAGFYNAPWQGHADFLIKCCDTPSNLGDYSYEVLDIKLERSATPTHIIQLCMYSELLSTIQGIRPKRMHLVLGDKKEAIQIDDFFYYYKRVKNQFIDKLRNAGIHIRTDLAMTDSKTRIPKLHKAIFSRLRDWLLSIKPDDVPFFNERVENREVEYIERKDWESDSEQSHTPIDETLSQLLGFHKREEEKQREEMSKRKKKQEYELLQDANCIAGLKRSLGSPQYEGYLLVYIYKFPPQEYKLTVGSQVTNTADMNDVGKICEIDDHDRILKIKPSKNVEYLPNRLSIGPSKINTQSLQCAIHRYAKEPNNHRAATDLLSRSVPRIQNLQPSASVISDSIGVLHIHQDTVLKILKTILALDSSYFFIQGPPGSGKTYISGIIIGELIKRGMKVGISSNSHRAIHNLLNSIERYASTISLNLCGFKKASRGNEDSFYNEKSQYIKSVTQVTDMNLQANLFAGTAWAFANEQFENHLDYLFIDEAGQVSTANVLAMANSTKNIILVGDQMQLGQPITGTHPGESGKSVLEFLLQDNKIVPPDRGIFLNETRRMRTSICQFISDAFYEKQLTHHKSTENRTLQLQDTDLPNEGIVIIPVEHRGCRQKSEKEGDIIKKHYITLVGQQFTDTDGIKTTPRAITTNDILVVSPYNMQVNYLRSILPENAQIGTVDKFQGQEAPIVLISFVSSSSEEIPRNIEFLLSKNRLNVAISRAQCLVVIVMNTQLLESPCNTTDQMKLINTFCRLHEYVKTHGSIMKAKKLRFRVKSKNKRKSSSGRFNS